MGEYLSATVAVRVPIVGRWKLAGISGKYPQVSGVSIPQISSYIHVTPHLCARGTLNSVACQYPDILILEDLKCSMFIDLGAPRTDTNSRKQILSLISKEFALYGLKISRICHSVN